MSHSIALHWNQHTLHAVVVRQHVGHRQVEAVLSLPIETGGDVSGTARRLTEALAPYSPARANIVVAVGREVLSWQHLSLPPCPGEDLADVVRLQALQDSPSAANDVGFDFLPLVGDQQTSHRVWAVALQPFELEKILNVCQSANLKPDRIVPLSLGYPPLAEKSGPGGDAASRVYIAPYGEEATLWTMIGARTILFRQLQLPTPTQPSAQIAAIASEIQRTKLALSQQQPVADIDSVWLVGCKNDECLQLAKALSTALEEQVQLQELPAGVAVTSEQAPTALPLIGLALQEAQGHPPLVDLLHPRQRPAPRNRRATYALLATAASALLALVGWQAYAALQAPLTAAEIAQAQWEELEETLAAHADAERQAATIGNWQQNSGNLLTTLEQLSLTLRPEPLDSQTFPVGDDTVLQRFDLTGRRVTLQGAVRNDSRVPPLEAELREQAQRVRREESKPNTDIPGYPWGYKFIVDVAGNPSAPEGSSR